MSGEQEWTEAACRALEGRTIVRVYYMAPAEAEDCGWGCRSVVLQLDNGLLIWPSCDDEGNGPGALFTSLAALPCIPVMH